MAKVCDGIEIQVCASISIPDETAERCMRLLEMWLDDHSDATIVCEPTETGKHKLTIKRWEDGKE